MFNCTPKNSVIISFIMLWIDVNEPFKDIFHQLWTKEHHNVRDILAFSGYNDFSTTYPNDHMQQWLENELHGRYLADRTYTPHSSSFHYKAWNNSNDDTWHRVQTLISYTLYIHFRSRTVTEKRFYGGLISALKSLCDFSAQIPSTLFILSTASFQLL